jgi:hypothetical protein
MFARAGSLRGAHTRNEARLGAGRKQFVHGGTIARNKQYFFEGMIDGEHGHCAPIRFNIREPITKGQPDWTLEF